MSNLPPNPYNNTAGPPISDAGPAPHVNHGLPYGQVPSSQLPPGFGAVKRDITSGSPLPPPPSSTVGHVNNYQSSGNNSPAFNHPGMMPPSSGQLSTPMRPPIKPPIGTASNQSPLPSLSAPLATSSPRPGPVSSAYPTPMQYPPNYQPRQINDIATPLIPSSQNQPHVNGPPMSGLGLSSQQNQPPSASSAFPPPPIARPPINTSQFGPGIPPMSQSGPSPGPVSINPPGSSQTVSFSGPPLSGPPRKSPLPANPVTGPPTSGLTMSGPAKSGPPMSGPPVSVPPMQRPPVSSAPISGPPTSSSPFAGPPISGPPTLGPPISGPPMQRPPVSNPPISGPPSSSSPFTGPPISGPPTLGAPISGPPMQRPPVSNPPISGPPSSSSPFTGPPISGPPTLGPPISGPPMQRPPVSTPPISGPPINSHQVSGPQINSPQMSGMPPINGPNGPPMGPPRSMGINGPSVSGAAIGPPRGPGGLPPPPMSAGSHLPPGTQPYPGQLRNGPPGPTGPTVPMAPPTVSMGPPKMPGPPTSQPLMSQPSMGMSQPPMGMQPPPLGMNQPSSGPNQPQMGYSQPAVGQQMGAPGPPTGPPSGPMGPPKGNMQGRYPQMPQGNYITQQPQPTQQVNQYPGAYGNTLDQQMSQLSVTKQGFDQLWGHQMVDLMTSRHILPEYPEDPPEIRLGQQFADAPNCSPEIFRCTINRMPDTNNLLQKSRLPLGILIHPFKDLNHLPVIQCATIVRCRACRTYINPFVYFVDAKRWKCNLCYRVNDLPEEFQYDPVSKSYGDPSRRPEIKSATIEFIAPGEYMLRPPQPAVYLFLMDVSQIARDSGYLQVVCDTLKANLDQLPGDARTQVGFVCFDQHIHYYLMSDGLTRPKEMTVLDIDDVFLPSPEDLLVNLRERGALVRELLTMLPLRHSGPGAPACALGAALQAAYKLMAPTGGRITVFQTCLPNVGPGALQSREDPNTRSSAEVAHLNPATDFYKRLALDCSGAQVAVDLFLLNSQYADLASLSGMSKFSAGTIYHIPLFRASRSWQVDQLTRILQRYLTRKIGFEAVMRIRCTRGIAIHTFHGNFFVRSTDLLSLPNVSPDAGFGMQLAIEESLSDLQQVCFQAALLYTSSKGERRIRVHTLALPVASSLTDVLHSADQQCIIGLLAKMAVERSVTATIQEAREALITVAVDALSAFKLAQQLPSSPVNSLLAPASLRLLPLYLLALLKKRAFRVGQSTRLDDRVADMCDVKALPLPQLMRAVYPDLYPVHTLREHMPRAEDDDAPDPPRLHLTAERINSNGAYLLDDGDTMIIYICHAVSAAFLSDVWGVCAFSQVVDEARTLPKIDSEGNVLLHAFIDKLNDDRPYASNVLVLRDNSPNRQLFTERLVDDRVESAFSYYEFLQHVRTQVK